MPSPVCPPGTRAPAFALDASDGDVRTLDDVLAPGLPAMLVFTDPGCAPCSALAPELARWQREHAERVTIVPVSTGARTAVQAAAEEHGLELVLFDREATAASEYRSPGTPSAVLIDPQGRIERPAAPGGQAIRELLDEFVAPPRLDVKLVGPAAGPGTPAPVFSLTAAQGDVLESADLAGGPHVLVFWRSSCGYCAAMLDRLRELDAAVSGLIVVSAASPDENRALALRAPVLHDGDGSVAASFGASGTPMAVVVDADGRIGSPVVAGAEAVLDLSYAHLSTVAV